MTGKQAEKVASALILASDSEEEAIEMLTSWIGEDNRYWVKENTFFGSCTYENIKTFLEKQ